MINVDSFGQCELKSETNFYILGDIHLDDSYYKNTAKYIDLMDNSVAFQKKLLNSLIDTGHVTNIIYENPICLEYFYLKYFETGDSTYISFMTDRQYEFKNIKMYAEVMRLNPTLNFTCIDIQNDIDPRLVLATLFLITFYEPNINKFEKGSTVDGFYSIYYKESYANILNGIKLEIKDELSILFDLYFKYGLKDSYFAKKKLKKDLNLWLKNLNMQKLEMLKNYLGPNFNYFCRIRDSYIETYKLPTNDLKGREPFLVQNIINCYSPDSKYYLHMGIAHVLNGYTSQNTAEDLMNKGFCFDSYYLFYYRWFAEYYPKEWFDIIEFKNEIGWPIFKLSDKNKICFID